MPETYHPDALAAARDYFSQPEPRFWTWGDDAISWTDGTTIVFHRELAEIFRRLAMDGLPRFTPLLLLLAACRDNYRRQRVQQALVSEKQLFAYSTKTVSPTWEEMLAGLDRVASLPADLRSTLDAKAVLIETVFAERRFFPPERALSAVALFRSMPPMELFCDVVDSKSFGSLEESTICSKQELIGAAENARPHVTSALLVMGPALHQLDEETLRLRLRTGLEQLVEPTEVELPEDESLRAFISRLRDDPELSGLGRLAHNLLAAVQVPRAVSDQEDLPLGGVSDIANRGPLDRLLVSELAHDDLTLAVRVAVGEALYLRREAPPRTPVRERAVLIDCGIRLWGVPRVYATAVGLALAATADRQTHVTTWRTIANDIEKAELGRREGLVRHLEQLDASPQPAAALARLFNDIDESTNPVDAILITHEDVLADRDFRRAVADLGDRQFFIATVEHGGRFRLSVHSGRGTKLVREAQFDLDRLFSPARHSPQPLIRQNAGSDWPVILSTEPFPLLLPHQVNLDRVAFHVQHGAVTLTHDRRLMHWRQPGQGAAQLTASVPSGQVRLLSIDESGVVRLVAGGGPNVPLRFLRANFVTGTLRTMDLGTTIEEPITVVFEQEVLYLIAKRSIRVISDEGQLSPPLECPLKHRGRRFFSWGVWYALSFDGHAPQLTRVPVHNSISLGSIAAMFDIQGRDGPWVITHEGSVLSTIDGSCSGKLPPHAPPGSVEVIKISDCGQRVLLRTIDGQFARLYLEPIPWSGSLATTDSIYDLYPELRKILSSGSLPRRFHQIGIDGDRRLTLIGRQGRAVSFAKHDGKARAVSLPTAMGGLRQPPQFEPAESPGDVGYLLRVARWADGSRAWLDSRGLLHLQSSDRALPELTLVLVQNGELAAWSSDGRWWGPSFYTGRDPHVSRAGDELLAEIDGFLSRLK